MMGQPVFQEREFVLSRIESSQGIFRAEGVAQVDGVQVSSIHYTELWHLGADGWIEVELSEQQASAMTHAIFDDVASLIIEELAQPL
ncbi:hypothetical protein [Thaumasiovibrio subtropicus]|uniref:hypothetical protein n=1 Tax=Thaumasiovibrio subtropicus TaxID=1891207 RepID=UPI000B35ECE7|nr:hypothetical protein [Thaumasiovibrio subtropicus]